MGARGAHVHVGDADAAVEKALLDEMIRFGRGIDVYDREVFDGHAVIFGGRLSDRWSEGTISN